MSEKNKKKKKRYKYGDSAQDVLTVLAILAVIILAGASSLIINSNPDIMYVITKTGTGSVKKEDTLKSGRAAIAFIVVLSFIIIILFIRSMIKRKKRESFKRKRLQEEKRQLEEARRRVEKARRDAFINAGRSEIRNRSERYNASRYNSVYDEFDELEEDLLYGEGRKGVRKYSLGDLMEEPENQYDLRENNTYGKSRYEYIKACIKGWLKKIKNLFSREKKYNGKSKKR